MFAYFQNQFQLCLTKRLLAYFNQIKQENIFGKHFCRVAGTDNESEVPGMKRALLEIIAAGVATTRNDAETYAKSTYLNFCLASLSGRDPAKAIKNTISFLIENEFIRIDKGPNLDIQLVWTVIHSTPSLLILVVKFV